MGEEEEEEEEGIGRVVDLSVPFRIWAMRRRRDFLFRRYAEL